MCQGIEGMHAADNAVYLVVPMLLQSAAFLEWLKTAEDESSEGEDESED